MKLMCPTAWQQLWCSKAAAGCQPAPLGSNSVAQRPLQAASPRRLEADLVLKRRCGRPARTAPHCLAAARCHRTAWNQLWCSKAAAGCQPAPLGSSSVCGGLLSCQPHRLVLKGRCGLPAYTAWKQLWYSKAAANSHRSAPLGSSFGAERPPLGSSLGAQTPLLLKMAASPHCLEAPLVLKGDCGLPARTAWKHLWCSKAAAGASPQFLGDSFGAQTVLIVAGCQPAPLGSSCGSRAVAEAAFGAQRPLKAASPHRLEATLVLQGRCGLQPEKRTAAGCQPAPLRTVWKQLWCSKAAAGCQPAPLASSF